jgi:hypothetical protein
MLVGNFKETRLDLCRKLPKNWHLAVRVAVFNVGHTADKNTRGRLGTLGLSGNRGMSPKTTPANLRASRNRCSMMEGLRM